MGGKISKKESGAAILMILIVASILFLVLSIALRGFFVSEKLNHKILNECEFRANSIVLRK